MSNPDLLALAVRVYPQPVGLRLRAASQRRVQRPSALLVFDTETRIDTSQRLTFGSYRYWEDGRCLEEGLFYADDIPAADRAVLEGFVQTHAADVDPDEGVAELRLLTRDAFVDKLYEVGYQARGLLVGFNLPFDLSRIALDVAPARKPFVGGFSLGLWGYVNAQGEEQRHPFRPRIGLKHIDSKRSLIGFTGRQDPDRVDLIPEGSPTGTPDPSFIFQGHFLDLRRLAYALTDRSHSLDSACRAFGVDGKQTVPTHGIVSTDYIDYNRRDVLATSELAFKLLEDYDQHPIALPVTYAYSPAGIGKAYLRAMAIRPVLERQPEFPTRFLGHAQSAFFGGRTSAHIRRAVVPVVYTDFLSMYPTVNSLMGLWRFVVASGLRVVEGCTAEIETFLRAVTLDTMFQPDTWRQLTAFVRVMPDGDILPARGQFGRNRDWQVGVNYLHGTPDAPDDALWYALPDVIASVLLTGQVPRIVDAFKLEPGRPQPDLRPTCLRGEIDVNPATQDFFRVVIEERKRLTRRTNLSSSARERLDKSLKVTANATSYGIYAEMRREESADAFDVQCYGIDADAFTCRVAHPDVAGEFCFPPLASLITSAARLMLALVERSVSDLGGTYAMEDTDSMAIVATQAGGLVPCPGGSHRLPDGTHAVRALSWNQVDTIVDRFANLNPYDREAIPGSVLKVESDNFDPQTGAQRQLYCLAISAKRYALFLRDADGTPILLRQGVNNPDDRWSEHGLGHLMNPTDPDSDDREWIAQVWLSMIRRALGLPTQPLPFEGRPAVGRVSVSSPPVLKLFTEVNRERTYADQMKPFNFLMTSHVRAFGHPVGADAQRFHLFAPYETDASKWEQMQWTDQYSGATYGITTRGDHGTRRAARVKTYRDVLRDYEWHPEAKCADADGMPADRQTIGLLQRRHVRMAELRYIGKESNSLEDVESGLVHESEDVYTEYKDPRRDDWDRRVVPALSKLSLKDFERETGKSRKILIDARLGRRRPTIHHQRLLVAVARKHGLL